MPCTSPAATNAPDHEHESTLVMKVYLVPSAIPVLHQGEGEGEGEDGDDPTRVGGAPLVIAERGGPDERAGLARSAGVVGRHALFRKEAALSYLSSMRESEVVRIAPPWSRWLIVVGAFAVSALIAATFLVEIDQTSQGRGVLRVAGGVHSVASRTSGAVLEVGAQSGAVVAEGAVLARIDSTTTRTELLEAERQIARAEHDLAGFVHRRDREEASRIGLLGQRAALLRKRVKNQQASILRARERLATYERLAAEGLASALDKGTAENELAIAERSALQLEEEISATNLQVAGISAELTTELQRREAEVQRAKDHRDALAFQLAQTEIRAPHAGRLEALVVKVGDTVQVGAPIARLIPEAAPREVVVFLPERDRAFLVPGADVRIELDQLPLGEFGALHASVIRIASDPASRTELTEALGETSTSQEPSYRVELALTDDAAAQKVARFLRPGALVTARFHLRTRRLAPVLFQPLKRVLS